MAVNVIGSVDTDKFDGTDDDGYSYKWMQAVDGSMVYQISDPDGNTHLASVNGNDIDLLTSDPHGFWDKYIN